MTFVAILLVILLGLSISVNVFLTRKCFALEDFVEDVRETLTRSRDRLSSHRSELTGLLRYDVFQDDYIVRTAVKCIKDSVEGVTEAIETMRTYSDDTDEQA